jgi:dCMP deaminase
MMTQDSSQVNARASSSETKNKASWLLIAYIPVLHNGYLQMLATITEKYGNAGTIALIDSDVFPEKRSLVKDLRAIESKIMQDQLLNLQKTLGLELEVEIVSKAVVSDWAEALQKELPAHILMPREQINEELLDLYLPELNESEQLEFIDIFLRWDAKRSQSREDVHPAEKISYETFDVEVMRQTQFEASKSLDWWRQVGAVLVIPEEQRIAIIARNTHVPYDQQPYVLGDPRADFSSGQCIEVASSIHAEALIVATAAQNGLSTKGTWMYATTFPCPVCAKLLAKTGISKLFYAEGYSLIHGQEILENAGIEIIQVVDSKK